MKKRKLHNRKIAYQYKIPSPFHSLSLYLSHQQAIGVYAYDGKYVAISKGFVLLCKCSHTLFITYKIIAGHIQFSYKLYDVFIILRSDIFLVWTPESCCAMCAHCSFILMEGNKLFRVVFIRFVFFLSLFQLLTSGCECSVDLITLLSALAIEWMWLLYCVIESIFDFAMNIYAPLHAFLLCMLGRYANVCVCVYLKRILSIRLRFIDLINSMLNNFAFSTFRIQFFRHKTPQTYITCTREL